MNLIYLFGDFNTVDAVTQKQSIWDWKAAAAEPLKIINIDGKK